MQLGSLLDVISVLVSLPTSSQDIRRSILTKWHEDLSRYGNLFSSDSVSGSTPPSVFVGSYGYPNVFAGPMVPPVHGDTSLLDSPERWGGRTLEEIVNFRLNLVRGIRRVSVYGTGTRYIGDLQEVVMSSRPIDTDLEFHGVAAPVASIDGESAPFGPVGKIKSSKFSGSPVTIPIERTFYDRDLGSRDAILGLYNTGIEISKIQRCLSLGMLGRKRKLVPTKWSVTATDDIISKSLVEEILNYPVIDAHMVFSYMHLGNLFSVVLFPSRWIYEMIEAWHSSGTIGFGADSEDARGIRHSPSIAGAYFAAKLGVVEYLSKKKIQSGVVVLREIRPEYAVPVGVWQVREGIRRAMYSTPQIAENFDQALEMATTHMRISKIDWLSHGNITQLVRQKTISDYF